MAPVLGVGRISNSHMTPVLGRTSHYLRNLHCHRVVAPERTSHCRSSYSRRALVMERTSHFLVSSVSNSCLQLAPPSLTIPAPTRVPSSDRGCLEKTF